MNVIRARNVGILIARHASLNVIFARTAIGRLLLQSPLGAIVQMHRVPRAFGHPDPVNTDNLNAEVYFHWTKPGFDHAYASTVANFAQVFFVVVVVVKCYLCFE